MMDKLKEIMKAFQVEAEVISYKEIKNGNINRTYRVDTADASYIVQAVNTNVFRKPVEVMKNIDAVTRMIREKMPDSVSLRFEQTEEGNSYLFDEGVFWRVFNYVDSITYNTCDNMSVIRNAGEAFGQFQLALGDFDASMLHFTIPDFHNTIARYDALEAAIGEDAAGRVASVQKEIEALREMRDEACLLETLYRAGELPLRVTHNDTKINNVLFDKETHQALTIIDLDTVMPGLVGHDFGDAIRFAANYVEEDCPDYEKAGINLEVFKAFTEGFISATKDTLTAKEVETLADSCLCLTAELAVRFLMDYIQGDPYFKLNYPEHNLVRTRCQLALAQSMRDNMESMRAIVTECMNA